MEVQGKASGQHTAHSRNRGWVSTGFGLLLLAQADTWCQSLCKPLPFP